ncbi:MAG: type II secretion system F family protein [Anaerolineales bacterium]
MEILTAVTLGFGLLLGGILFLLLAVSWVRKDEVSQRVKTYVGDSEAKPTQMEISLRVRRQEIRGSFLERTVFSFFRRLFRALGNLMPASRMAELDRKLQMIGNPFRLRAREFSGLQVITILLGLVLAYFAYQIESPYSIWLSILILLLALASPTAILNSKVQSRQNEIRKELPNVIDMLSICTSAGLGFDQSLQRVSSEWHTQLSGEIGRVVSEMEMGLSRKEALRNLADRVDINELSSFVSIIIQSDQLGMSISDTLHTLAQQMRVEWRFKAQEESRKIPVKILIPLTFFIFPAMLAVILGPSIPSLLGMFRTLQ